MLTVHEMMGADSCSNICCCMLRATDAHHIEAPACKDCSRVHTIGHGSMLGTGLWPLPCADIAACSGFSLCCQALTFEQLKADGAEVVEGPEMDDPEATCQLLGPGKAPTTEQLAVILPAVRRWLGQHQQMPAGWNVHDVERADIIVHSYADVRDAEVVTSVAYPYSRTRESCNILVRYTGARSGARGTRAGSHIGVVRFYVRLSLPASSNSSDDGRSSSSGGSSGGGSSGGGSSSGGGGGSRAGQPAVLRFAITDFYAHLPERPHLESADLGVCYTAHRDRWSEDCNYAVALEEIDTKRNKA